MTVRDKKIGISVGGGVVQKITSFSAAPSAPTPPAAKHLDDCQFLRDALQRRRQLTRR